MLAWTLSGGGEVLGDLLRGGGESVLTGTWRLWPSLERDQLTPRLTGGEGGVGRGTPSLPRERTNAYTRDNSS